MYRPNLYALDIEKRFVKLEQRLQLSEVNLLPVIFKNKQGLRFVIFPNAGLQKCNREINFVSTGITIDISTADLVTLLHVK